jgi:hypothetical protein
MHKVDGEGHVFAHQERSGHADDRHEKPTVTMVRDDWVELNSNTLFEGDSG